jgi:hypothetical protein
VTNNELMDFLSRVPDDEMILDARYVAFLKVIYVSGPISGRIRNFPVRSEWLKALDRNLA